MRPPRRVTLAGLAVLLSAFSIGLMSTALARAIITSGIIFPVDLAAAVVSVLSLGTTIATLSTGTVS